MIDLKHYFTTMKSCIAEKQCKLGKALDIEAPLFLTKHITVFYYYFLSIEKTVICYVKNNGAPISSAFPYLHCFSAMQLFIVGSRDMNQEIYFNLF